MKLSAAPLLCALLFPVAAAAAPAAPAGEHLRSVVILSRHGVRSPTVPLSEIAQYASEAWPTWEVAPGMLTSHGRQLMVQMGHYYAERFRSEGLIAADSAIYTCADSSPRTIASAGALLEGMSGRSGPPVEILASNFGPKEATGPADPAGAAAKPAKEVRSPLSDLAVRSRFSDDIPGLVRAYRRQFDDLGTILGKKTTWADSPAAADPAMSRGRVTGPVGVASSLVEDLVLEYTEGMPVVGWGRMTREQLADIYLLHALQFDFGERTPFVARRSGSTLARRILASLNQAAGGQAVPGAFGPPSTKITIVGAHDGNIAQQASLLGATWISDGLPNSPTLPGGALVFELWQHDDGAFAVRGYYIAQTLDQMRASQPLDLSSPPSVAILLLPGGTAGPDHEAPLPRFAQEWSRAIGSASSSAPSL